MLIVIAGVLIVFMIITLAYFLIPKLSFVPFFPTNQADIPLIVDTLIGMSEIRNSKFEIQASQVVIDLGAGTGTVIFPAAKKYYEKTKRRKNQEGPMSDRAGLRRAQERAGSLPSETTWTDQPGNTRFIAVEIHPTLILLMHLRRLFHSNRKNIVIMRHDIFDPRLYSQFTNYQLPMTFYLYVSTQALARLRPQFEHLPPGTRIITYMYEVPGWQGRKIAEKKGKNSLFEYKI